MILSALSPRFDGRPIAIDRVGVFRGPEDSERILASGFDAVAPAEGRFRTALMEGIDVVFPIVHGEAGEDGTLQGFLETLGIPYVGSGVASSALGMNKAAFKARLVQAGLPVGAWTAVDRASWNTAASTAADQAARMGLPLFVKPSNGGSSLGVSKVREFSELKAAIELAFEYDRTVLVEKGLDAREIECAVLGNEEPRTSGAGEIVPGREFYDYEDKYLTDGAKLLVPAPLAAPILDRVRELATRSFELCGCSGLARVDFFLTRGRDEVFVNEINTLPGFTSISMYPKLWEHEGLALPDLVAELVRLALERAESRRRESAARCPPPKLK
jgi:D-alanine-D-alanine ligase